MAYTRTVIGHVGDFVVARGTDSGNMPRLRPGVSYEIVGFERIHKGRLSAYGDRPGIYLNRAWPILDVDGARVAKGEHGLEPAPGFARRPYDAEAFRVGDLPETAFWEGDLVRHAEEGILRVRTIEYENIGLVRNDGATPMPTYTCDTPGSGYSYYEEGNLALHRRGNLWRHHHGMPTAFASLDEAAKFHVAVGGYELLTGPGGTFAFTAEEALEALRDGTADCDYDGIAPFESGRDRHQLVRLDDRAVGDACREVAIERLELSMSAGARFR